MILSGEEAAAFIRFRMALRNSDDFGVAMNVIRRLRR
jgi:hypothetical protein